MPIIPRSSSPTTYEERIAKVAEILTKLHNPNDAQFIKNFIFDLCKRFIDKSKEFERYVNPQIEALDRRYVESIIKDLDLENL
jgi:hypothetical protein